MVNQAMVYSDQLLIPTIQSLQAEHKATTILEIAARSQIPYSTVKRRLHQLERIGIIRRRSLGKRWGSFYEVTAPEAAAHG